MKHGKRLHYEQTGRLHDGIDVLNGKVVVGPDNLASIHVSLSPGARKLLLCTYRAQCDEEVIDFLADVQVLLRAGGIIHPAIVETLLYLKRVNWYMQRNGTEPTSSAMSSLLSICFWPTVSEATGATEWWWFW